MDYIELDRTFGPPDREEDDYSFLSHRSDSSFQHRWDDVLENRIVIVLASASSGKTEEFRHQAERLSEEGDLGVFCAIEELAAEPLHDVLGADVVEKIDDWKQGKGRAWFFLDSVDEAKLVDRQGFRRALRKLRPYLGDHLSRANFVISCRPSDWNSKEDKRIVLDALSPKNAHAAAKSQEPAKVDEPDIDAMLIAPIFQKRENRSNSLDESIKAVDPSPATNEEIEIWRLNPLDAQQQKKLAVEAGGVAEGDAFIDAIAKNGLEPFARRPGDLLNLAAYWQKNKCFGSLAEMTEAGIDRFLAEEGTHRPDGTVTSETEAKEGACRLAAALVLGKRLTILSPGSSEAVDDGGDVIRAEAVLPDWAPAKREALLRRGLFAPASYGRIRFQHRTSLEFLAARWFGRLLDDDRFAPEILKLFFPTIFDVQTVTPELRPIAAWIAITDERFREAMLNREPLELIRYGDPKSFSAEFRQRLLLSFAKAERQGDVANLLVDERAVWAFASPDLSSAIRQSWKQAAHWRVKLLLLSMIRDGPVPACADLAEETAMSDEADSGVIVEGIEALKALKEDKRLFNVAERVRNNEFGDANEKLASITRALYPNFLSTADLMEVVKTVKPSKKYSYNGFAPRLTSFFTSCPESEREYFLQNMADLALSEPHCAQHERISTRYGYLTKNFVDLAHAVITMDEGAPFGKGLVRILMGAERGKDSYDFDEKRPQLSEAVNTRLALKEALFWADVEEVQRTHPDIDFETRPWFSLHVSYQGRLWGLYLEDIPWLLRGARDENRSELHRLAAYFACLEVAVSADVLSERYEELREVAQGKPRWLELLNAKKQQPKLGKWEKRQARRKAKAELSQKKRDAIAAASWRKFRIELRDSLPTPEFSEGINGKSWGLMYELTRWLSWAANEREQAAPRSWRKLIPVFGEKVAFAYRDHFKQLWRSTAPRRPKWTGSNCSTRWTAIFSFAGIGIEADDDPNWAWALTADEARLACRHLVTADNGAPDWMADLVDAHWETLRPLLRNELKREWGSPNSHPDGWMREFSYGDGVLPKPIAKIVFSVLTNNKPGTIEAWDAALKILRRIALSQTQWRRLEALAEKQLAPETASLVETTHFLAILCLKDINLAIDSIEAALNKADGNAREHIIGQLFDDRHGGLAPQSLAQASVSTLERLIHLAYDYVPPKGDRIHPESDDGDTGHTVGRRDYAECARNAILNALMNHPGPQAYEAMRRFSTRPNISDDEYWYRVLSKRMVESGASLVEWVEKEVVAFEGNAVAPIKTGKQSFDLACAILGSIGLSFEQDDASSKALLALSDDEEKVQDWLFEQVSLRSNHRFHRVKEAEVKNKKKPDLILSAVGSNAQIAIEVKHGDKGWTVSDLCRAIDAQLVKKYLKPEYRRSGILAVTRHRKNFWKHPETEVRMSFTEVIEFLNEYANGVVRAHPNTIRLSVIGIDAQ